MGIMDKRFKGLLTSQERKRLGQVNKKAKTSPVTGATGCSRGTTTTLGKAPQAWTSPMAQKTGLPVLG